MVRGFSVLIASFAMAAECAWGQAILIPPVPYVVANAPYTALIESEWDGGAITAAGQSSSRELRDSAGRQRLERTVNGLPVVTIVDVVSGRRIAFDGEHRIAHVTKLTQNQPAASRIEAGSTSACTAGPGFESIGTKQIAGLEACGMGRDGLELWRSVRYGIPLEAYRTSPGSGHMRERVVEFRTEEPDPALFRIPDGYAVEMVEPKPNVDGSYPIGNGVSPPRVLSRSDAEFSEDARKAHISGSVLLRLKVGEDGMAHDVTVVHGPGYGLNEKAVEAVMRYHFAPAMKDGHPVTVSMQIEVNFQIFTRQ